MTTTTLKSMISELYSTMNKEIENLEKIKIEYSQYVDWVAFCEVEISRRRESFMAIIKTLNNKLLEK